MPVKCFCASKMHLSPPVAYAAVRAKAVVLLLLTFLFIVTPVVGVCNCSMFCCTLLCVLFIIAIILMGKRESWLHCLICLPGVS